MEYVKSEGGPLVCIEEDVSPKWQGVFGCSAATINGGLSCETDYEVACSMMDYVGAFRISERVALILGDVPMETTVWTPLSGFPVIVRVVYMDPETDLLTLLNTYGGMDSLNSLESMRVKFLCGDLIVFDAACSGDDFHKNCLRFSIPVGDYSVYTKKVDLNNRTCVVVHEFAAAG